VFLCRAGCSVGSHAFARFNDSGVATEWTFSRTVTYNTTVLWQDGSSEVLNRRERPQLVFDDSGTPVALTNGAMRGVAPDGSPSDRSFTLIVPIRS
jgi:hypothetical protein